ncbi:MAG TPA: cytochrome c biogenesis protein CcsA [Capsulimonadaceae bacterium]|jgi:cytochrome c-type biogenesis protein CcmF
MMVFGTLAVWLGLALIVSAIILYVSETRKKVASPSLLWARRGFYGAAACVLAAAVALQSLLQAHRFDVNYVYHYSARELNPFYLFATFWAGQEGSFLLWAFWIAVLGVALVKRVGGGMEARVMPFYASILAFLLLILTIKSPFVPYGVATAPDEQVDQLHAWLTQIAAIFGPANSLPATPANGMGLQPLLENPWMVIHPPTLFLGFAASAIPFVFALAALAYGDSGDWFKRARGWGLFCFAVLGFGIMLGGYWAYETLGWGGFWGWDPVENGPLVPWLLMGGFVHASQVQHARQGLRKSVYALALLPFLGTLYETFLTRTGILSNFSNHSFSTLGGIANGVILWGMVGAMALAFGLMLWRRKSIASENTVLDKPASREFGLLVAVLLMIACALITGAGMSAPLITDLAVKLHNSAIGHSLSFLPTRQSSVDVSYYNKANFPVAVLMGFAMAVGPYLAWRKSGAAEFSRLQVPWAIAVVLTIGAYIYARVALTTFMTAPMLLLLAASLFALMANGSLIVRMVRASGAQTSARTAGGYLAHVGAAILLLGIVLLVSFQRVEDIDLVTDHPAMLRTLPFTVTYTGMSSNFHDRDNVLKFNVERNSTPSPVAGVKLNPIASEGLASAETFAVTMPCAIRKQEAASVLLARPAIQHRWWGDLYFALKAGPEQVSPSPLIRFKLAKNQSKTLNGYTYTFRSFSVPPDVGEAVKQGIMPAHFPVIAEMDVKLPDGRIVKASPQNIRDIDDPLGPQTPEFNLPKPALGTWWGVTFEKMNADTSEAEFFVRDLSMAPLTRYTIEVSTRPMIWLVWVGTVLMALGSGLAARRRALEARLVPAESAEDDTKSEGRREKKRKSAALAGRA